jgi:hypothetical protein
MVMAMQQRMYGGAAMASVTVREKPSPEATIGKKMVTDTAMKLH